VTGMRRYRPEACGARAVWLAVAVAFVCRTPTPAAEALDSLACGVPLTQHLNAGAADSYNFAMSTDAAVVVDAADISGSIGLIKLGAPGIGETCAGSVELRRPTNTTVTVSDCVGADAGDYAIVANVVSDAPQNCGRLMPCGITPHVQRLNLQGQVDAYTFSGTPGDRMTIAATDITGDVGGVSLRLFDPDGMQVSGGDPCADVTNVQLDKSGTYTALASACGLPQTGLYGIGFQAPECPAGPDITYFGIARADGSPQTPVAYDDAGRPMYQTGGSGFFVVIEAQPGPVGTPAGCDAFQYDAHDPTVLPDVQVLMSRPLGNGSPAVCDKTMPNQGGVPSVFPLEFAGTQAVADAINDFGCRVNDGTGQPRCVTNQDACTFFPDGEYHFVNPASSVQFCASIAHAWGFPPGDTVIKARVRDTQGVVGAEREIVVRVGAPQQAAMVKDLAVGAASSNPDHLTESSGLLFFTADDQRSGTELWSSNGTASGTQLVRDIRPGPEGSAPTNLTKTNVNADLFFSADDGTHGVELWKTDATESGTSYLRDINPGAAPSSPSFLTKVNEALFFAADDGSTGVELWTSDVTNSGTVLVKDINPGSASSSPAYLTDLSGTLLFSATDGVHGIELWKSDRTAAGTVMVADIRAGTESSAPAEFVAIGPTLFFTADDGVSGRELWGSDGSAAGTLLVRDIRPGAAGSSPANLTNVAGILYFTADDGIDGTELWRSNGTESGTVLVADIRPGADSAAPAELTAIKQTLFFVADDGIHGRELWNSNGTAAGTTMVRDIIPGSASSTPMHLYNAAGTLVFAAADTGFGVEPWKSDGTQGGTARLRDIAPGALSSDPASFTVAGSKLFFTADNPTSGRELWAVPLSSFSQPCPGDCNGDGEVTVDELVRGMTIVLGPPPNLDICPAADSNGDGEVTVDDIIRGVNAALNGCPQ
jgi:ELWxxDGT repeat protein